MPDYYIGLISGTSMDGIDAALVEFGDRSIQVAATLSYAYPEELRERLIIASRQPAGFSIDEYGELDHWAGECFRDAALALLDSAEIAIDAVRAIGSHGQTVRHRPDAKHPFTIQVGNADVIAKGTGIDCVADFRSADVALGGEGAPLVPLFHHWLLRSAKIDRCILNIGGIANVTLLPASHDRISGFDTGPGNTLMDAWSRRHEGSDFDESGRWASTGRSDDALLTAMLGDPYFAKTPPKSTGFEYFNEDWLSQFDPDRANAADVQATLCELTARSIAGAIFEHAPGTAELLVCGGGIHNNELMRRLAANLPSLRIVSTIDHGLDPDWVEACAFAWLAMRALESRPGNAPSVTGASRATILGAIHRAG
jgi:anhydro-N-acetylmuramic acid kinase